MSQHRAVSGHLRRSGECLRERGPVGASSAVPGMIWSGNSPGLHCVSPVSNFGSVGFMAVWILWIPRTVRLGGSSNLSYVAFDPIGHMAT